MRRRARFFLFHALIALPWMAIGARMALAATRWVVVVGIVLVVAGAVEMLYSLIGLTPLFLSEPRVPSKDLSDGRLVSSAELGSLLAEILDAEDLLLRAYREPEWVRVAEDREEAEKNWAHLLAAVSEANAAAVGAARGASVQEILGARPARAPCPSEEDLAMALRKQLRAIDGTDFATVEALDTLLLIQHLLAFRSFMR